MEGNRPVVCFSEQPLSAFIRSYGTLTGRCKPYGIAVRKDRLFEYGGRPVIYSDGSLLSSLSEEYKHLWVNFQPIPNPYFGGYPLDWTHEREWRATVNEYHVLEHGTYQMDGVPLLLPPDGKTLLLPWILVRSTSEALEMRNWIKDLPEYSGSNGMMKIYRENLRFAPVLALEVAEAKLAEGAHKWGRFDTLPYEELSPESASTLEKVGWNETVTN